MDKNQETVSVQRRQRRRFTQIEKQQHLDQWQQSGLSAAQYGKGPGLPARYLYAWRSQLNPRSKSETEENLFLPVRLSSPVESTEGLSVSLRHGDLEFVVSGVESTGILVSTLRAIKQEVLSV